MPARRMWNVFGVRLYAGLLCLAGLGLVAGAGPTPRDSRPDDRYETVRISKPDGTVIEMRVLRSRPLLSARRGAGTATVRQLPGTGTVDEVVTRGPKDGGRVARGGNRVVPQRASSEGVSPERVRDGGRVVVQRNNPGVVISHPYTGTRELSGVSADFMRPTSVGRRGVTSQDPVVASDEAEQWRTGRGWVPFGEDDDRGDYLSSEADEILVLVPGDGWNGVTQTPDPVGDDSTAGFDAEIIGRWDEVPYQTVDGAFAIGIVAFHMNGIDRIEMALDGGPWKTLDHMQINPRTGVLEYVAMIPEELGEADADGLLELRAKVYPSEAGLPRVLEPFYLYVDTGESADKGTIYVAASGDPNTGDGSALKPYATIQKALNKVYSDMRRYDGGEIVLTEAGRYDIDSPAFSVENNRWITIRPAEGLDRDDVIIAAGSGTEIIRPKTKWLKFEGLSVDFSDSWQMYKEDTHKQWYENCKWFSGEGWGYTPPQSLTPVRNHGYPGLYITDSEAYDTLYGFVTCNLVRNCHVEKISGDAYQNSLMVVNSTAHNLDSTVNSHHTDLFQFFGHFEDLIVYNVNASQVISCQNFFLDHYQSSFTNCAFVNIAVQNAESDPPFSQLNSAHDHVLFYHISNPGQRFGLRDDFIGEKKFTAHNVVFRNSIVERIQAADYFGPIPEGVTIDHCHFAYDDPKGEEPTTGAIAIINSAGGRFTYKGNGAAEILGTARPVPGLSLKAEPDRGAWPWE